MNELFAMILKAQETAQAMRDDVPTGCVAVQFIKKRLQVLFPSLLLAANDSEVICTVPSAFGPYNITIVSLDKVSDGL